MKRPPFVRAAFEPGDLVVDNFAGGGGASEGIERAIGRPVDIAVNHDPEAIAVHRANHPETRHYLEDVWEVDPREACGNRRVALAWFSPDCTHFSRAKGSTPLRREIRGLAWVVIRWARAVRPRVIVLENVEEFQTWGPLREDGRPDPGVAGETFRAWLAELSSLGYTIEHRSIVAADYGAPTTRKRFYLVASLGGGAIAWPEPTHGKGRAEPWRTAAEVIDWSIPCPSIFGRKRELAEATLRRIAIGVQRYVIDSPRPFVIPLTHQGDSRVHGIDEPLRTVTGAHRGELAVVEPFIVRHGHYSTLSGAGLREGCGAGVFRGQPLGSPLATVCGTNDKHLVVPVITKHYGGMVGHGVERPIGTVTSQDHHALTAAFLTKFYGTSTGSAVDEPLPTVTANDRGGGHLAEVAAFIVKQNYGSKPCHGADEPLHTVTTQNNKFAEVRAFLVKYYGAGGRPQSQSVRSPLHTVTTKARFGLGVVVIGGEPYRIVDIGMRMLQPGELFGAQGFPEDYEIAPVVGGKPLTKTAQIRLAGNSVCPPVAEALVAENLVRRAAA